MSNPSPLIGAIIFAWYPEDENPNVPGPKYRPVLVVDVDLENKLIRVAKGTSQHIERCGRGELLLRANEIAGLPKDTKICLRNSKWIPMASEYLHKSNLNQTLSVLGRIPAKRSREFIERLEEV